VTTPLRFGDLYKESAEALKPLPDGEYTATVSDAEATKSQNDKPMIRVKLAITTAGGQKKLLPSQLTLSMENPTAVAIFFRHMEAFGLGPDFWTNDVTLEQAAIAMRGKTVRVVLDTGEWNGQPRNNVKNYLAPLGGPKLGGTPAPAVLGGAPASAPLGASSGPAPTAGPIGQPGSAGPASPVSPAEPAKPVAF
jgi:hypothetical protein